VRSTGFTPMCLCRIEPQRLPNYLEEEVEDLAQKIGDAWNKVARIPPGTVTKQRHAMHSGRLYV